MVKLTPAERRIADCLLLAMENRDIAKELGMSTRTVKAVLNRMFLKYGIDSGIKRVKLAVILYREEKQNERHSTDRVRLCVPGDRSLLESRVPAKHPVVP